MGDDLLLGRYRVLEQLDAGGFGTVFLAFDERIMRRVAIKTLPVRRSSAHRQAAAAGGSTTIPGLEEARTAAMLNHPAIVSLLDFQLDEKTNLAYLIMEYVDGLSLADIPSDYLSDDLIAAVAKAVGDALAFAHKNGVLHLDVKPANILIDHEGHVKLADFGLAQLSRAGGKHGRAIAGTLGYMPLEQLRGEGVDAACDQWAFAAVLYELLADEYPYYPLVARKPTLDALLDAQTADEPALLELGTPELDAAFARALARNPQARYDSVADFTAAILPELGGTAAISAGKKDLRTLVSALTSDEPDDQPGLDSLPEKRRRGCLGLAASLLLKTLGALALATLVLSYAAPNWTPFVQLAGNNRALVAQLAAGVFIIVLAIGLLATWTRRRNE